MSRLPTPPRRARPVVALVATDITHAYAERVVLDDVSITAAPGRRIGLVGDNGSGKSTLLRLLAGLDHPDAGRIVRPANTALLEQDLRQPPETTIHEVIEDALAELRELAQQVQELSALVQRMPDDAALVREYGDALELAHMRAAWDADHRVARVMRGLGLHDFPRSRAIGTLSGGERARVAMAALLVRQPEALLLDEPTNHLDEAGLEFVERHLCQLPGVLIVSSHDRAFLDAVCTDIVDIDPSRHGITRFGGSFGTYLVAKRRARQEWERAWHQQETERALLESTIAGGGGRRDVHERARRDNDKKGQSSRDGRAQAAVARRIRDLHSKIAVLDRDGVAKPPDALSFRAAVGASLVGDEPLVRVTGLAFEGRIGPQSFEIRPRDRLLLSGPNGSGKSTLIDLIIGELEPTSGVVEYAEGVRIGVLPQDPEFPSDATPNEVYRAAADGREDVPDLVDLGLLDETDLDRPMGELSEGQRRRVALAMLIAGAPHVLLLDEPTNHLSPSFVSDLEVALDAADAAVVIVSHDRWLRARWMGRELRVDA